MANVYAYQSARDMFYGLTGWKSSEENILEGEQTQANTLEDVLHFGEMRVLTTLFPFYQAGKAPQLETLERQQTWNGAGALAYDLPADYYGAKHAYIDNGGGIYCPITMGDSSVVQEALRDPWRAPQVGTYPTHYVPAFTRDGQIVFIVAPTSTQTPAIYMDYVKTPKFPSGTNSEIHASLLEMTVLHMVMNALQIDGDDVELAIAQSRIGDLSGLVQGITNTLGFNPYEAEVL